MIAAVLAFLGYTGVMLRVEQRIKATGGPGIITFELAGTAERAEQMMATWGPDGCRAAVTSLRLDFGYMPTYGTLFALVIDRVRRRRGHSAALPFLAVPAVAADAVEGVYLLKVLQRNDISKSAHRARTAALVKFAVLVCGLGYAVVRRRR
jgi:hypothetical protein